MLLGVLFVWVISCFVLSNGEMNGGEARGAILGSDANSNSSSRGTQEGVGGLSAHKNDSMSSMITRLTTRLKEAQMVAALLEFLVSSSTGRQLYLLHDFPASGVSWTVVTCCRTWHDVTVIRYTPGLEAMEDVLSSHPPVHTPRNVFVVCSLAHTIDVFKQVRRRSLESEDVHWFLVLEENVTKEILADVREGTQVSAAVKEAEGRYHLHSSHVNINNSISLESVGWWSWSATHGHQSYLYKPLYRRLSLAYSDFGGRRIRAAVVDNWPFFEVTTAADGSLQPLSGIDYQVLNALGDKLNFTYQLVEAEDGQWGGVQANGSVTGMIGLVARHMADLAINEITITSRREEVVDFTAPYFLESTTLISPAPAKMSQSFAIFSPFTLWVWVLVVVMTLAMGPVMSAVAWLRQRCLQEERRQHSLQDFAFNMFRSLVVQGNLLLALHWEQRIVFFTWYFFCFTVYAMYAGTLTAFLAIPAYEKPIDSLWDLLHAVKQKNYKPIVVYGTSNEFIFKEATRGIYRDVWQVFDHRFGYVDTYSDGMDKVLKGKYVFLNAQFGAEIRAVTRGRHKYYFARNAFYPQGYGIACTSGSPFRTVLDRLLTQMSAAGLVQKWTRDEVTKVAKWDEDVDGGPGAITLLHLQAAFFLLVLGYMLGGVALLLEKFLHGRHATTLHHTRATTTDMERRILSDKEELGTLPKSKM